MANVHRSEGFLTRAMHACLFLLALSAPVSIAATQTAWALALLVWLVRAAVVRPRMRIAGFDLALIVFVGSSLISSFFSYEPEVSLRKMVAVSLVTIVYLVSEYVGTRRFLYRLTTVVLASCFAAALFTFATQAIGKNLKVVSMTASSPLRNAGVSEGYTILRANGIEVHSPDELYAAISEHSTDGATAITVYRHELIDTYKLPAAEFAGGLEGLGIQEWSRGRDTRAAGFYGHYITFAEVLQLIASLALGLIVVLPGRAFIRTRLVLGVALAGYCLALFLSVTRASWAAFAISAGVIILLGASRRTVLICLVLAIPVAVTGLLFLQQKRQVGFFDMSDGSTQWRVTVWHEGLELLASEPRHLAVGIGMDSIKKHYLEWGLFDNGKLPIGHMHSTPLQIALERGVPALLAWLIWMGIYLKLLWSGFRKPDIEWAERGLLLGAFGGTIGFLVSGLVHYNWGDSEVVMVFYLIMGLSLSVIRYGEKPEVVEEAA